MLPRWAGGGESKRAVVSLIQRARSEDAFFGFARGVLPASGPAPDDRLGRRRVPRTGVDTCLS